MANWFIGLPVAAQGWLEALPPAPDGCRRFAASDLHLTVAFLGSVSEDAARAGWAAVRWPDSPVAVSLGAVVPMGSARRYSALSALLLEGRAAIEAAIARSRLAAYAACGARPDERPVKAHVTIARPLRSATNAQRQGALTWATGIAPPPATLRLDRVALYTWSDDRAASLFRIVEEASLPKLG
jgi:RNA 2',3'-cyclic 3'-phosphodiesterase